MAPKGRSGSKGFASMDEERKKRISRKGGIASARARKTSNRGFASMDKNKLKEISRMGGKASKTIKGHRASESNDDAERKDIISEKDALAKDLDSSLEAEDDLESSKETQESLSYSETDEDEDEGLGDGNLGRSTRGDVFGK